MARAKTGASGLGLSRTNIAPRPMPRPEGAPAAPWDPRDPVFSEAVFSARLARALDALLAIQRANAAAVGGARRPRGPRAAMRTASRCTSPPAA